MCDKTNCNYDYSGNPCCDQCEPSNCIEQAVNDVWSVKQGQINGLVEQAETAAENSEASSKASADSAAESKKFRDEAEVAASTAVAAEGIVLSVVNDLQNTANILNNAIAGIAVSSWFYTTVSENQTVIPVPSDKNAVDVQSIYIDGTRQSPFRGFEFDKTAMIITLAEPLPLGLEIEIILGTYNSDNPNDFAHTLASNNGARLVGTASSFTVQEELDANSSSFQDGAKLLDKNNRIIDRASNPPQLYIWDGEFPKSVPAGTTPASTGGVAEGAWQPVGDVTLREELASAGGALLVGFGSETVEQALESIFEKPSAGLLTIGGINERQKLGFDLNGAEWTKDLAPVTPAAFKNLDNYCLTSGVFEGQLEITVGPGGDFPANGLNAAIAFASKFRPKYKNAGSNLHNRIDVKILSGVTITEGVNARGLDLSHIRLTSVDPTVPVNFDNGLWWMYGEWQCKLPIIATIFDMQRIGFDGASVKMGSQLVVEYGQGKECGIINAARHNVFANTGCNVVLRKGVFTGAGGNGIHLEKGCTGCAREANVSGSVAHGVQLIASDLDIHGINASGSGQFAVLAQSGSTARGFGVNGANCGSGLKADNGSKIIAPSSTLTGIGASNAIALAGQLSEVDITGSTLSGGSAASLALFGGKIVMGALDCSNTGSASSNIRVLSGGLTFASGATGTTSISPNTLQPNGIIFK